MILSAKAVDRSTGGPTHGDPNRQPSPLRLLHQWSSNGRRQPPEEVKLPADQLYREVDDPMCPAAAAPRIAEGEAEAAQHRRRSETVEDVVGSDPAPPEPGGTTERALRQNDEVDPCLCAAGAAAAMTEERGLEREANLVPPTRILGAALVDASVMQGRGEAKAVESAFVGGGGNEEGDEGAEAEAAAAGEERRQGAPEALAGDDSDLHRELRFLILHRGDAAGVEQRRSELLIHTHRVQLEELS